MGTHLSSGHVDEEAVYATTGQPCPNDIEQAGHWLFNYSFKDAVAAVKRLQEDKGIALVDLIKGFHALVMRMELPPTAKCDLVEALADIEHRLAFGVGEFLQLTALVGSCMK